MKSKSQPNLPSFSIIIETENLASADIKGLSTCLDTLAAQDLSPKNANEILIMESGDVPIEMMEHLQRKFPWITVRKIELGISYYEAKLKGTALTTGEIIVLCDSDCQYERSWLRSILTPFAENPEIQIVAGETTTSTTSSYDVAIALTYIFPRFTRAKVPYISSGYFCNNVAFRRDFVLCHPIPLKLPVYRGNCTVHCRDLERQNYKIWRQPQARATHAVPNGLSHFFWRFLLLGYDALAVSRIISDLQVTHEITNKPLQDLISCLSIISSKLKEFVYRFYTVFSEDPRRLIHLPLAFPIAFVSLVLFFSGLVIGYFNPSSLLTKYNKV
ncbi:glycosyltransferase [Chroococcidiopsis sp.]|uniref:glycosyltransferase n=1 Tax=Chroococcidiopsis sp. TaxID=3088168 RepID=UPI003F303208